mgnify:CR=1 FL=1
MAFSGSSANVAGLTGRDTNLADLGASFLAITATPGTGVIGHAAPTTFDETKPYFLLYNAGALTIYPAFLKLHTTVVGVAGARVQFTQAIDSVNRWSSVGTALTINNTNMASNVISGATIRVGAPVATAASPNRRVLSHRVYRAVIEVVEDTYCFSWGSPSPGAPSNLISSGTTVTAFTHSYPALAIGPGQSFLIHQWRASQSTGPTFEVEFAYYEK